MIVLKDPDEPLGIRFERRSDGPPYISGVVSGSAAERASVPYPAVLVAVNGEDVQDGADILKARQRLKADSSDEIVLTVRLLDGFEDSRLGYPGMEDDESASPGVGGRGRGRMQRQPASRGPPGPARRQSHEPRRSSLPPRQTSGLGRSPERAQSGSSPGSPEDRPAHWPPAGVLLTPPRPGGSNIGPQRLEQVAATSMFWQASSPRRHPFALGRATDLHSEVNCEAPVERLSARWNEVRRSAPSPSPSRTPQEQHLAALAPRQQSGVV